MNWLTWSLLTALFAGLTAIFAKVGVANIDSNLATAVRTSVVLVLAWIVVRLRTAAEKGSERYPLATVALTARITVDIAMRIWPTVSARCDALPNLRESLCAPRCASQRTKN